MNFTCYKAILINLFIIVLIAFFSTSCSNTRYLSEGEYLHESNQVEIVDSDQVKNKRGLTRELKSIAIPEPNRRFLGLFRIRLQIYNLADRRKENRFRWWLKNNIGEPPVKFDSLKIERSKVMMTNYLLNKGYFYAEIDHSVEKQSTGLKTVYYTIRAKDLYRLGEIAFQTDTTKIRSLVNENMNQTLLKTGDPFDVDVMQRERERISRLLRDNGYFYFNREFVSFDLDSTVSDKKIDVLLRVNQPQNERRHQQMKIRNIYVYPDYDPDVSQLNLELDTVKTDNFYIIRKEQNVKSATLINNILINPGDLYSITEYERSLAQLSDLGIFRFVNIRYQEVTNSNELDCLIFLTPAKRQEMSVEAEVNTHSETVIGAGLMYRYRNRNIFRGAEVLSFNVSGGVDFDWESSTQLINTSDFQFEAGLLVPKFMIPVNLQSIYRGVRPKTRFTTRFNYLNRFDFYTVFSSNFLFGYEWRGRNFQRFHSLYPISFNLVSFDKENANPAFLEILERSPLLNSSFSNQFILGLNYNMIWNTQPFRSRENFFYFIWNIDIAGNMLNAVKSLYSNIDEEVDREKIFSIPYSQYAKTEGDFRYYINTGEYNSLVLRLNAGLAVPYGNSEVLPYVKQFFAGGPNSIRAWRVRSLGPGGYNIEEDDVENLELRQVFFDQTGDIKIEANLEYRFDIIGFFKGAVFTDIGNIWLLREDSLRPYAEFSPDRFYREIAVGGGLGARLDFNFFVIRFDFGFPLRDPAQRDNPWRFNQIRKWSLDDMNFNLAIGYPF
ncbi:MAG: hypothetical protein EA412_10490 [Chitinophagaceae bacterium]|nr:MAG: hypothetical protein EA412_10490 [Chitinophagaceae bacterium]